MEILDINTKNIIPMLKRLGGFLKKRFTTFPANSRLLIMIVKKGKNPEIAPVITGKRNIKKKILNFSPFIIISNLFSSF